jgi:hypothetical protein
MKNHLTAIIAISISFPVFAQQTVFYTDPETKFQEAKAYFQKEQYKHPY